MNIDIKIGEGPYELEASIDGKDVSSRLKKVAIDKSMDTIPVVTMTFIPETCHVNGEIAFATIEKELKNYPTEELLDEVFKREQRQLFKKDKTVYEFWKKLKNKHT
ncbi:hypothetical protein Ccar_16570 [Clostridium carboxidivorans P7]|uniref:hypothetical protein n=1 Tax=Clostridium carboxidivorans TaxID=217159 RepID=UPI00064E5A8A|nr:hypothetical protein [Clostridium carboxidivorans]AKN32387.1 hypothetical protein Ccar_16570 [Clostridium carboxidivorans P7]